MALSKDDLSEVDGGPCVVRPSLYAHLAEGLEQSPNGEAVVVMHQPHDHLSELIAPLGAGDGKQVRKKDCLAWSYTQLHQAALRGAAGLAATGLRPGAVLMTFMPNGIEYPILLWAACILKVTLATLDPGALGAARTTELENYLRTLRPDVVLVPDANGASAVEAAISATAILLPKLKVCLTGPGSSDWRTLPELAADGTKHPFNGAETLEAARHDDPDRWASVLFTSGTSSGKPKGCPRHVASVSHVLETNPWDMKDVGGMPVRFLLSTPNYRVIALQFGMAVWKAGGTVVMPPPSTTGAFDPAGTFDAVEKHGVTTLLLIPVILHALTADASFSSRNLSSLGAIMVGADIITSEMLAKARNAFSHCRVSCAHGMTETGGIVTWPFFDQAADQIPTIGGVCPIGVVSPGVRAMVSGDGTKPTQRGEPGELCFSAAAVIKHYFEHVNPQSFFVDDEGRRWFRTGDLGIIDKAGSIFIVGRIKDIIKRGGLSITPAALESGIGTYTGVETCVVAASHPELGQEPFVVLKERGDKSDEEIRAYVVDTFGKDHALGGIASLKELGMDRFPLNATAKILKFEVENRVAEFRKGKNGIA